MAAMSQQPHEPSGLRPAPPEDPPPMHFYSGRVDDDYVPKDKPRQRGRTRTRDNRTTFNLAEMSQHLHPEDEKALDEGIIVSRFSELQLPSWNASLGVGLPNPVGSMVDDQPPKADTPDDDEVSIETVKDDEEDLKIIHDGAVQAVLTETGKWELPSGETPVTAAQNTTDVAVASASEGDYFWSGAPLPRARLMPTTKAAPRPKPSANRARVTIATTSTSSASTAAWASSMVSDIVRANESARANMGAYERQAVDAVALANPQDTDQ